MTIYLLTGFGLLILFALVWFAYLGIRQVQKNRELLHLERLKAFECGINWREPGSIDYHQKLMHNAFYIAFWTVSFGCGSAFTAVGRLSLAKDMSIAVLIVAWVAAALSSIAACICACILIIRSRKKNESDELPTLYQPPVAQLEPIAGSER